ncbi:MAG: thioredoxin domain-containing protein [Synergistota bacterium]|nr:thioredoxin domain-containing protein [Synergistota bacterium]OPZ40220.1 MAG: hypothetical protein BWY99_00954 [Synergistetes bacterium ADurb.BinA166]
MTDGGNRLSKEKSPYLLRHAGNPVDWRPWGQEAFDRARGEDKPLFVSIGYAACHWCGVMERESFADAEVANLLNDACIPVKVDREERPDIDAAFMAVCEMMNGSGGWPLNVFLTPEGLPFFAATYMPKRGSPALPGIVDVVPRVKWLFKTQREQVERSARSIRDSLVEGGEPRSQGSLPGAALVKKAFDDLEAAYDREWGGFSRTPKFPMPSHLHFLLRYWRRYGEDRALSMVRDTIGHIWRGGIRDHLGGGLARYSTDRRWLLPHFEKMLYDQALMLYALAECREAGEDPLLDAFAADLAGFVLGEMAAPEGGFCSATGADGEGEEGGYYLWTEEDVRAALPPEKAGIFICAYGIRKGGNVKNERTGRILGDNVLHIPEPRERTAARFALSPEELEAVLASCRATLLAERNRRPRPPLDDKILADWNGLMIAALARASSAFGRPEWLSAAERAARFVELKLRDRGGRLLHRYRDGESAIPAFLDDYAFMALGLTELSAATGKGQYTEAALRLADEMEKTFSDPPVGGLYSTSTADPRLFLRRREAYDGALPSGNSVAVDVFARLSRLAGRKELAASARRIAGAFSERVAKYPLSHTWLLASVMDL